MEFHRALALALAAHGQSLDQVARELRQRGTPISTSTLSAWQTGLSRPERAASVSAVIALEELLGLPGGQLRGTLPLRRPRGRRARDAVVEPTGRHQRWGDESQSVRHTLGKLDADWRDLANPRPLTYRAQMHVGPQGEEAVMRVTRVLKGGPGGATRMLYVTRYACLSQAPLLTMAHGCRLVRFSGDTDTGIAAFEFALHRPIGAGELILTEFGIRFPPRQTDRFMEIRAYEGMRDLVLETSFNAAYTPIRCQAYYHPSPALPLRVLRESTGAAVSGEFQYIHLNPAPGIYGIRWG